MPTNLSRTILVATDQQRSVLSVLDLNPLHHFAYTPYGHRPKVNGLLSSLGFNGELPDPLTGHYHLGKGYRQFNPVLMRFNSPDSWSPFGKGGVNSYAYCKGDPRNLTDSTGHAPRYIMRLLSEFRSSKLALAKPSKVISKKPAKILNKYEQMRKHRADLRELANVVEENEIALAGKTTWTRNNHISDIADSKLGYETAKYEYKFSRYPDPDVEHTWLESPPQNCNPGHYSFRHYNISFQKHVYSQQKSEHIKRHQTDLH
ncbi:hypothetical protein PS662_02426 [Pseudomonas fluorescens]|uniref:RHS repeat-associated core domain-containing protein n=1 Tax=Pseudomonas fluorescens TaxID=294 RepID=A0A5E6SRU1_PSEFL|nr:RHS repeat-associated core domain-containing protein [Pseudomonas fluorescens]VVM83042.1 hypothetical protein PS662_02426 [Pseudomonas fluorescens]